MSYNKSGFSFAPNIINTFDPQSKTNIQNQNPFGIDNTPYVPGCNNTATLEKEIHKQQYDEYVKTYGQKIAYQPTKYNLNTHNFLYGEDPTSGYYYARYLKAVIDFTSYTTFLSKWGVMNDSDITIYIPISHFKEVWGESEYPLAGDLFYVVDSACDRPLKQSPMVFEVSEKHDSINPVDFMGGHYVWKLTAKRYDYSFEPNATEEKFLGGINDSKESGREEGGANPPEPYKKEYPQNVDDTANEDFKQVQSSIYGKVL